MQKLSFAVVREKGGEVGKKCVVAITKVTMGATEQRTILQRASWYKKMCGKTQNEAGERERERGEGVGASK